MGYCQSCGRQAELQSGPDGGLYCMDCSSRMRSDCEACISCARSSGGVLACPFCAQCPGAAAEAFIAQAKKPILQPIRMEERCERCGGSLKGRAFILHRKALCRDGLLYEQDKWEIVTAKPGGSGTQVKIVIEKPKSPAGIPPEVKESPSGRMLLHAIGVDPADPPKDPFSGSAPINEKKMADDSCIHCDDYTKGKKQGKFLGSPGDGRK